MTSKLDEALDDLTAAYMRWHPGPDTPTQRAVMTAIVDVIRARAEERQSEHDNEPLTLAC